jgi:predicted metal-dependent hydrolase
MPSRERDQWGRPLPPGVVGFPGPISRLDRTPEETIQEAQEWFDAGQPFAAHEVFEDAWKSPDAEHRDLWQGLAQLAVALTHTLRGNQVGASALVARSTTRLQSYQANPPYGVDVLGLLNWAAQRPLAGVPQLRVR